MKNVVHKKYADHIGNTMAYEWWKGRREKYWRLEKLYQMAITGSKTKKRYGAGPFPR